MSDVELDAETDDGGELQDVWNEFQRAQNPDDREFLLERLAQAALDCHDFSDPEIQEELHSQFEQLRELREEYHLVAVRVGRFVARMMEDNEMRARMKLHADGGNPKGAN